MDWRSWVFERLSTFEPLTTLLPQLPDETPAIFGSGSITEPPAQRPFLVIRLMPEVPGPFEGVSTARVRLAAHDEPGDYTRLDGVLSAAGAALLGAEGRTAQVPKPGAVACVWQGDSEDLADPDYKTIFRTSDYDLPGRR